MSRKYYTELRLMCERLNSYKIKNNGYEHQLINIILYHYN